MMNCQECNAMMKKFGKNRNGSQRYRCNECKVTCTDEVTRPVDKRRVPMEKMILALRMLLEGNSVRSVERLLGVGRDAIIANMVEAGENCKRFLEKTIHGINVEDVQGDEIWAFVGCKEKTRIRKGYSEEFGDAFCFTALERNTKLMVAWHLGKRSPEDTLEFAKKLRRATNGHFQLTVDGYKPYRKQVPLVFGNQLHFAQLVKVFGKPEGEERQYSPPQVVDCYSVVITGKPDEDRICTSHVERANKTMRMQIRRLTRLTDGHSKKWENHEAALALFFCYYNFVRVHGSIGCTPAVKSGLATETWSLQELLAKAEAIG